MPSRTIVDEANLMIMSPTSTSSSSSKNSKANNGSSKKQRDPPADPPGIPVDADFSRMSPRRTQSDTDAISPTKKARSRSKLRDKKGVTRRKSADGDECFADMLPPPIPTLPPSPTTSGGKQKKSKLKVKGGGIGVSSSSSSDLPPKSPAKRSQHSRDSSVLKSPGILKPSKYTTASTPNQQQQSISKDNNRISASPSKLRKSLPTSPPLDVTTPATPTKTKAKTSPSSAASSVARIRNRSPSPASQRAQVARDIADQEAKQTIKHGKSSPSPQRQKQHQANTSSASSTASTSSSQTKKVKNLMDTKKPAAKATNKEMSSTASPSKSSTKKSKSASKSSIRAPSPLRAPSPSRQEIASELAGQETKVLSKGGRIVIDASTVTATNRSSSAAVSVSASTASSSSQQQQQGGQTPGAYLVQGQNVALATSGMLSPQEQSNSSRNIISSHSNNNRQQQRRTSGSEANSSRTAAAKSNNHPQQQEHPIDLERAPPVIAGSLPSPSNNRNLVVAAELSTEFSPTDIESLIEQQVQQRLQQNTVRANVVSVVHGKTLYDPEVEARRLADLKELHKPRGVKEKLFGDARNADIDIAASPDTITKRVYLKLTVRRNPATNLWVASVQTSQKAAETNDTIEIERNTLSFPATTQQEAFETGLANATPLLHPTEQHPICNVCKAKFALFRQPRHCRNCGVCICSSCCVNWPSKMLPETYQTKNTSQSQICLACDFLANSFRDALLEGNYKSVQHLYSTGNINLRTPFCIDRKAEAMYPIHLAILGGNVKIVKWLCSERFCPLRMPKKRGKKKDGPIVTSKGRSALGIALLHQKLDIVRYLVAEMDVSLFEEKHINTNMALANFTSLLKMLPENIFEGKKMITTAVPHPSSTAEGMSITGVSSLSSDSQSPTSSVRRPSLP